MLEKNYRHINKDIHYFCLMRPVHSILEMAFYEIFNDRPEWVECEIVEDRYKVDDNYKVTLKAVNGSSWENYYQDDFLSLIYEGLIIPKLSEDMHIEYISFDEPIPNTIAYIRHEGQCVVGTVTPVKVGDIVRIKDFDFVTTVTKINEADKTATVEWQNDDNVTRSEVCELEELVKVV